MQFPDCMCTVRNTHYTSVGEYIDAHNYEGDVGIEGSYLGRSRRVCMSIFKVYPPAEHNGLLWKIILCTKERETWPGSGVFFADKYNIVWLIALALSEIRVIHVEICTICYTYIGVLIL